MTAAGLEIIIRPSKTDQRDEGRKIACPTARTRSAARFARGAHGWPPQVSPPVRHSGRSADGALEDARLSDRAVSLILKRRARQAGIDSERLFGHSLRAGGITAARRGGASKEAIMRQSGHRSVPMVRRYIRGGDIWRDNPAARSGL